MQALRPHPRSAEPECAFELGLQAVCTHMKVALHKVACEVNLGQDNRTEKRKHIGHSMNK